MTTDNKINNLQNFPFGNLLICGLQGIKLEKEEKNFLKEIKPIGIILFQRNFDFKANYTSWLEKLYRLINEIKEITNRDKILISIDHEGGHVIRTPAPLTKLPYPFQYKNNASIMAEIASIELKSLGVNYSFAPIADINSNINNPVINIRAFSDICEEVSKYSKDYLLALKKHQILSCAKHFPGHGDSLTDSHHELPFLDNVDYAFLKNRELKPFIKLIKNNVDSIMTAHMTFSQIDQEPVTMSKTFLTKILRDDLNFKGVIISDDLEMKAVQQRFLIDTKNVLEKSLIAGINLFIVARSPWLLADKQDNLIKKLNSAFQSILEEKEIINQIEISFNKIQLMLDNAHHQTPFVLSKEILLNHCNQVIEATY